MESARASRVTIGVWYVILLLIVQFGIYLAVPKAYTGCVRYKFPPSETTTLRDGEQFYCRRQNHGYEIVGEDEFIASYSDPDYDRGPIVIAGFYWTYARTAFRHFSLWSLGKDHRYLHFEAREGSHGEYQPVSDSQQFALRRDIAGAMRNVRYLQPANGSVFVPIVDVPGVAIKLLVNALLLYLAAKIARAYVQTRLWWCRKYLRPDGVCVHCAYDCHDLPGPICPECGHEHGILA